MFRKVIVPNRGEIAARILLTLKKMGICGVLAYAKADEDSLAVDMADEVVCLGAGGATETYLDAGKVLEAAKMAGADALHPGYGFLSENAAFARRCAKDGICFIGPSPELIETFGRKHAARSLAGDADVPVLPGTGLLGGAGEALALADEIGYPVMLKSTAGGGGIGMRACHSPRELEEAFPAVSHLAEGNFHDAGLFLERCVPCPRHVEVQVFGNRHGETVAFTERDCSLQRRNQKIMEESPAPGLPCTMRGELRAAALRLAKQANYRNAGTVEFLYDAQAQAFYFLEVNTRLQVEHGITEAIHGIDLVEWMVKEAAGELTGLQALAGYRPLASSADHSPSAPGTYPPGTRIPALPAGSHALEARIYAEDPWRGFLPCAGRIDHAVFPGDGDGDGHSARSGPPSPMAGKDALPAADTPNGMPRSVPPSPMTGEDPPSVRAILRVDTWIKKGSTVSPLFDPLLAKIIVTGADRAEAIRNMRDALDATRIYGVQTNAGYLRALLDTEEYQTGGFHTGTFARFSPVEPTLEVLEGGIQTTVQSYPGFAGYWSVGVPPCGPMDSYSFRLGNRLLGNREDAPGLEMTLRGGSYRFRTNLCFCLAGADMGAKLDAAPIRLYQVYDASAGSLLELGACDVGMRTYLLVAGGFDVPAVLGSAATFVDGRFGGHGGRALRTGDVLHLGQRPPHTPAKGLAIPADHRPTIGHEWIIGVLPGPQPTEEYLLPSYMEGLEETVYEVNFNSNRTGVRLNGPAPQWSREDGGDAGLHPSNIHDNAYAVGALDLTGDQSILLGVDGPSLGGFVCPVTTAKGELWKLGQLRPGDRVRFRLLGLAQAKAIGDALETHLAQASPHGAKPPQPPQAGDHFATPPQPPQAGDHFATTPQPPLARDCIAAPQPPQARDCIATTPQSPLARDCIAAAVLARETVAGIPITLRLCGDENILAEFGEMELDIGNRLRVHVLMGALSEQGLPICDLTPGIRSLQVSFDTRRICVGDMADAILEANRTLPDLGDMAVPSRVFHLPLSFDDPGARLAAARYQQTVRPDAPWCPSNLEFIRRINGLPDIDAVRRIVFDASYLVLGLGDVYLGAPVATPIDPRHRLVTTKYNPARPWTPENAVGIGGAYLCIYGMEGPGGYQLVGRTLQMWNPLQETPHFPKGKPWLLNFFDQIRFYPMEADELLRAREDFPRGRFPLQVEDSTFRLDAYRQFLKDNEASIRSFAEGQSKAFAAERAMWKAKGLDTFHSQMPPGTSPPGPTRSGLPDGVHGVRAGIPGSVWKILSSPGHAVRKGEAVLMLESMKMEFPQNADLDGVVDEIFVQPSEQVAAGQLLFGIRQANTPSVA
ncbi:MAG: 5-oxoprolinase/urea amidolyase family protein [Lachnospiraceae bacterium]|jgi:urea carboxylase|nr:5-oxoprolinase/urea amidolyase family protein [Lachnospiraceae bacterium]